MALGPDTLEGECVAMTAFSMVSQAQCHTHQGNEMLSLASLALHTATQPQHAKQVSLCTNQLGDSEQTLASVSHPQHRRHFKSDSQGGLNTLEIMV